MSLRSSSSASSPNGSPSSSPAFGPVDSSPPSSPTLVTYTLDSSPRPGAPFLHPFAASIKATKPLPDYEKKALTPPPTPPGTFTRSASRTMSRGVTCSRSLQEDDFLFNSSPDASPLSHRTSKYINHEEHVWDEALRLPFDTGIGQIDLSNQQLKYIPPSISDLSGFFNTPESSEQSLFSGRALGRMHTAPAVEFPRARSFERTQSIKDSGKERHVLKLYLMGNMITLLPHELFSLKNLTVLSLRGNRLTSIPPDICRLTSLNELNISNNQLKFLPWQMRNMKIEKLLVHPNPFLPEPSSFSDHDLPSSRYPIRSRQSITRLHSPRTEILPGLTKPILSPVTLSLTRIPPLMELCFRRLFAPSGMSPEQTMFACAYDLPLSDEWDIPPHIRRILMRCAPGAIRPRKRRISIDTITPEDHCDSAELESGTCPNPAHDGRVFVRHACERYSWERQIAGVDVGGVVPMRWRGCLWACLDFLDEQASEAVPVSAVTPKDASGEEDPPEGARDVDMDISLAVQAVDLGNVSLDLDMDDFED